MKELIQQSSNYRKGIFDIKGTGCQCYFYDETMASYGCIIGNTTAIGLDLAIAFTRKFLKVKDVTGNVLVDGVVINLYQYTKRGKKS